MQDHVEISHLTKFHAFRVNRDQVMDLETWFKIHTNFSNVETVSPKTIYNIDMTLRTRRSDWSKTYVLSEYTRYTYR